jgi:hypothetical protein
VGSPARPGDIHTPQGDKPCLAGAGAAIDLEIIRIKRGRCLVIPNGEDVIVILVGKAENQTAVVEGVRDRLHPSVGQRHRVSDEHALQADTVAPK